MEPMRRRLHELKEDILDLEIASEESEIGLNKIKEFIGILGKIDTETEKGKEAYLDGARKYLDAELEDLRNKSSIIRKVSPKTANFLEEKINDYDKTTRYVLERFMKSDQEELLKSEFFLGDLYAIAKVIYYMGHLRGIVMVSYDIFQDTIDYLEGKKNSK